MPDFVKNIIGFISDNWVAIIAVLTATSVFLKALRDSIDKTPLTDDNVFERVMTIIGKLLDSILKGKRPS